MGRTQLVWTKKVLPLCDSFYYKVDDDVIIEMAYANTLTKQNAHPPYILLTSTVAAHSR